MAKYRYTGGGVILKIKIKGIEYIVFPKRSKGAVKNPDCHSGFFGGADRDKPKESSNPRLIASRELNEELLIISRKKDKTLGLKIKNGYSECEICEIIKKLCILWRDEKNIQ